MSSTKGYCEDLTEGKMSFPIIHAIHNSPDGVGSNILNILKARTENYHLKSYVVTQLRDVTGSLKYTADKIVKLQNHALSLARRLEPNEQMEALISMLAADDENVRVEIVSNGENR